MRLSRFLLRALIATVPLSLLASCASLGYYGQAIGGHLSLLSEKRPIAAIVADRDQPEPLRERLAFTQKALRFAHTELKLPDNGSYRDYADLKRPYAVWNVVAAPELSIRPRQWCFLVTGCISYRGYFSQEEAESYAAELSREGYDVHVSGASAYSTLGWFSDPLLNTFIDRSDDSLVELLFHELAHQRVYVPDDSRFNEAFAVAVAEEGMRRWFERNGRPEAYDRYRQRAERRRQLNQLLLTTRRELAALYAGGGSDAEKRRGKRAIFAQMRAEYRELKGQWDGYSGYDNWMAGDFNNARLALTATYQELVPAFRTLLAREEYDLDRFFASAERIAGLTPEKRRAALRVLQQGDTLAHSR